MNPQKARNRRRTLTQTARPVPRDWKGRSKTDWAGIGIGDAFKAHLEPSLRIAALRTFNRMVKKAQITVARHAGCAAGPEYQPKVKAQISPCYTSYPSTLAACAAVGLTAYLEFKTCAGENLLRLHIRGYLKNPARADRVMVNPDLYKTVVEMATDCVETRLLIEELARVQGMVFVEAYRLFSAAQQDVSFRTLHELLNAVVLYGDVLPDWERLDIIDTTREKLRELTDICRPYFEQLAAKKPPRLLPLGARWVRDLCPWLEKYCSSAGQERPQCADHNREDRAGLIAPLEGPGELSTSQPEGMRQFLERAMPYLPQAGSHHDMIKCAVRDVARTVAKACGQERKWEDMRSDLVEDRIRHGGFAQGPIEGNPIEGHEVQVHVSGDRVATREIYDVAVEESDDTVALEKLLAEAGPFGDVLRKNVYPNTEQNPAAERFRSAGSLDPGRLAVAEFSAAAFRRYRAEERPVRKGKALLVIACDGSGSLNRAQMSMVKILTAGWLTATVKSDVKVIAALYHSEGEREAARPLVRWIRHPHKTTAGGPVESVRALLSLPDEGTGVQSDALSIAFILQEARRLAQGCMVYLILISDTRWNRCLLVGKSGREEVQETFLDAYRDFGGKLHTTLVALGVAGDTGFEGLLEKVIPVSEEELTDHASVAEKIGVYVASCIRERRTSTRR